MKKFGWMTVAVLMAQVAWANDSIHFTQEDGNTVIQLSGNAQSATSEIFSILDKAGFKSSSLVDGRELEGEWMNASVFFLNGARYSASFTISSDSHYEVYSPKCFDNSKCTDGKQTLQISGVVARELYDAMDIVSIHGKNVSCEMGVIPDLVACFISLQ